ncbi:MAG: DUF1822 family protein [Cyanobacteria bacterium P01_D01_bin.116]
MMRNTIMEQNDLLLALQLEFAELEAEDFEQSAEISHRIIDESLRWQTYQNALGLIGFEKWLKQRKPELQINKNQCSIFQSQTITKINAVCNLKVNDFIVCLINKNDFTDEFVEVTKAALDFPEFVAHFYVLIEVLEEQEQVIINGFLRYDELNKYRGSVNLQKSKIGDYQLPISLFKSKPSQLLLYLNFLAPSAIPIPSLVPAIPVISTKEIIGQASQSIVNLSRWLHGAFDTGWQATEAILPPSNRTEFAFRFREGHSQETDKTESSLAIVKRGKLLNLGIEKADESVVLIVGFKAVEEPDKFQVSVEICSTKNQTYLPQDLQLMVLDETGNPVMQAQARNTNKNICLDFKGNTKEQFSIKVILGDTSITENFVI